MTGAVRKWGARPDLLADPDQREGDHVWTTFADVLGRRPQPGDQVTAAWGDSTWRAVVREAPDRGDELWLFPPLEMCAVPRVADLHPVREVALAVIEGMGLTLPPERVLEVQGAIARALAGVMGDFQGVVDTYEDEVRATREVARQILKALRVGDPPKRVRRLLEGPTGEELARIARLSRRPTSGP